MAGNTTNYPTSGSGTIEGQDEGSKVLDFTKLNFAGAGVVLTDVSGVATVTITGSAGNEFPDNLFRINDNTDATKQLALEVSAITTGTTRTITMPDQAIDLTPGTGTFATEAEGNLAGTALQDVIDDTTPQLGGDLDTNGNFITIDDAKGIKDENGNEQVIFQTTASAVNQIDITNSATGNSPSIDATGGDTNIGLDIGAKGTGVVKTNGFNPNEFYVQIACSDLETSITTGTSKGYARIPHAGTLTGVRASLLTAPTGSVATFDINKNGTTVLSTKITVDATEKTSETAVTAPVISVTAFADDDEITIDFDGVGSTEGGKGVIATLIFEHA